MVLKPSRDHFLWKWFRFHEKFGYYDSEEISSEHVEHVENKENEDNFADLWNQADDDMITAVFEKRRRNFVVKK